MSSKSFEHDVKPDEDLNWADYVDALLRPNTERWVVAAEKIKGRRLRDQYLDEVTVIKVEHPLT